MTQAQALTILKTGAHVFLTGEPGAGKTHTINAYITYLRERGIEPAVTASTGIAATHIGGMTIHSWSGIGVRNYLSEYDLEDITNKERIAKRIQNAKVLIIDEISMLSGATLTMVDQVCRAVKRSSEPFGGLQVILVGDFFQLPPIVRTEGGWDTGSPELFENESRSPFAFDAPVWKRLNLLVCYLSEQHRQEDQLFLDILSAMRRGEVGTRHTDALSRRASGATEETLSVPKLYTHNADVDRINIGELTRLEGSLRNFVMESTGPERLVDQLKRGCLSPELLGLKLGAKVMFTKNAFDMGYVNGTLGTVIDFNADDGSPIVETRNGEKIIAFADEWPMNDGDKVLAKIKQVPLRLAWAITVHKSQGMSLDAAYVDLSRAFEYGQGYVALSRVRSLNGLYLAGFNARSLAVHPTVSEEDASFRALSEEAEIAFEDMSREELVKLHTNFLHAAGGSEKPTPKKKEKEKKPKGESDYAKRLETLRKTHANAYKPWTDEDDTRLSGLFEEGNGINQLASVFERKPGAIIMRLKKLGLIDEDVEFTIS